MTRVLPPAAEEIGRLLAETAGGYLHNTIREHGVTCTVCTAPVGAGFTTCSQCRLLVNDPRTADRVATIIYAPYQTQAYTLMRGYKGAHVGPSHTQTMRMLLGLALQGHVHCVMALGGDKALGWAVVPSLSPRTGEHPLHAIVASLTKRADMEVVLTAGADVKSPRGFVPENFVALNPVAGHILLIDDSWVSGSHAQSAAAALKAAGATEVSTLIAARVLQPEWRDNIPFIKSRLVNDFDYRICPWTGGVCP